MTRPPKNRPPAGPVIALIGDLVASRRISAARRGALQGKLQTLLTRFNQEYATALLSEFVITTGDEFQAVLRDPCVIPDVVWEIQARLPQPQIRIGVGFGELYTPLRPVAIGMDGPAFHAAREAIRAAAKKGWLGGVFAGFGEPEDTILNGFARLLQHHRAGMTDKRRKVAGMLRGGKPRKEVARALGITAQAVSDHARSMGWDEYSQGEAAWRTALRPFGTRDQVGKDEHRVDQHA